MSNNIKPLIQGLLKFALAFGILYWLYSKGHLNFEIFTALASHPIALIACLLMTALTLALNNERWRVLLENQKMTYSRVETGRLTLIGQFFNFVMPGGVGGDIIKSYYLSKARSFEKTRSVLTILMDRLIGLHAILILGSISMLFDFEKVQSVRELQLIFYLVLSITLGFTFVTVMFLTKSLSLKVKIEKLLHILPFRKRFVQVFHMVNSYNEHIPSVMLAYLYSFLSQSIAILFMYIVCRVTYGVEINPHGFFIAVPIGFILTALPISPAGVGVGQAAFLYLFGVYDPALKSLGPSSLTAWQASLLLYGVLGGVLYAINRSHIKDVSGDPNITAPDLTKEFAK